MARLSLEANVGALVEVKENITSDEHTLARGTLVLYLGARDVGGRIFLYFLDAGKIVWFNVGLIETFRVMRLHQLVN